MEIMYGNTIPLTSYFLLILVLLFTNFLSISIFVSELFISASSKHSTGNHSGSSPVRNEVSEMALNQLCPYFFFSVS